MRSDSHQGFVVGDNGWALHVGWLRLSTDVGGARQYEVQGMKAVSSLFEGSDAATSLDLVAKALGAVTAIIAMGTAAKGGVRGTQPITWDIPAGTVSPSEVASGGETPTGTQRMRQLRPGRRRAPSTPPPASGLTDRLRSVPGPLPGPR